MNIDTRLSRQALIGVPGQWPPPLRPSYGLGIMGDPESHYGVSYGHGGGGPGCILQVNYWPDIQGRLTTVAFGDNKHAIMRPFMHELLSEIR